VAAIDRKRDQVSIRFTESAQVDPARLAAFVAGEKGAQFSPGGVLKFTLHTAPAEEVLARLRGLLENLAGEAAAVST
ncbi:MAG TPA: hypothetical protein VE825_00915, partial [Terriglobales bacterium]|nr:hypothetical protein [Terriglobales bacterium]